MSQSIYSMTSQLDLKNPKYAFHILLSRGSINDCRLNVFYYVYYIYTRICWQLISFSSKVFGIKAARLRNRWRFDHYNSSCLFVCLPHIAFLAIYRLERHNQYNRNTFLYQNCQINRFQGSNKRKLTPLLSNTPILARFQPFFPNLTKKRNFGRFFVKNLVF